MFGGPGPPLLKETKVFSFLKDLHRNRRLIVTTITNITNKRFNIIESRLAALETDLARGLLDMKDERISLWKESEKLEGLRHATTMEIDNNEKRAYKMISRIEALEERLEELARKGDQNV